MKTANEMSLFSAEKFMKKTHAVLDAQVMYAGIELDLFKRLHNPVSVQELVKQIGYNERNLELLLNALTSFDLLNKDGDFFGFK